MTLIDSKTTAKCSYCGAVPEDGCCQSVDPESPCEIAFMTNAPKTTERFVSPCKPPEGWEREILTVLVEECAEVQQRASKSLRFGVNEVQPKQALSNAERLGLEIGDLLEVIEIATRAGLIAASGVADGRENKRRQLAKFMQHPEVAHGRT